MRVLATMPGKFGDILWSLPTVRAIAEAAGEPVDLCLSRTYGTDPFCDLLKGQSYLRGVFAEPTWIVRDTAPMTPQRLSLDATTMHNFAGVGYDKVIHLGYERWPQNLLPVEIYLQATGQWGTALPGLKLDRPWVEVEGSGSPCEMAVGFSDEWFELKLGLLAAVTWRLEHEHTALLLMAKGSRWDQECGPGIIARSVADWNETAQAIRNSDLFLGCLSAQWVLANALGIPTVIMEPSEPRHNPIFFYESPRNTLVLGNDGKPTFDARAVVAAVKAKLA